MGGIFSGERGFAPAVLVLVVVWAFAAVLMLTGTLLAANRIDDSVKVINPEVAGIAKDTKAIELAAETARISTEIRKAAEPLTGELAQTLTAAKSIDATAKQILTKVLTIGRNVLPINSKVLTIGSTVDSIDSSVDGVSRSVKSIDSDVRSINASVHGIQRSGNTILSRVRSIDGGVAAINRRASTIREVALQIGPDLNTTLARVGTIDASANSIDCARLLNTVGTNSGCKR